MCLVLAWKTGLDAKEMADTLSHQSTRTLDKGKATSLKILHIQVTSADVCAKDRYSTSVEERATLCCFFAL